MLADRMPSTGRPLSALPTSRRTADGVGVGEELPTRGWWREALKARANVVRKRTVYFKRRK